MKEIHEITSYLLAFLSGVLLTLFIVLIRDHRDLKRNLKERSDRERKGG
jgi:hypothetical protein